MRCDGIIDCPEESDELNCKKVVLNTETYLKNLPPASYKSGKIN